MNLHPINKKNVLAIAIAFAFAGGLASSAFAEGTYELDATSDPEAWSYTQTGEVTANSNPVFTITGTTNTKNSDTDTTQNVYGDADYTATITGTDDVGDYYARILDVNAATTTNGETTYGSVTIQGVTIQLGTEDASYTLTGTPDSDGKVGTRSGILLEGNYSSFTAGDVIFNLENATIDLATEYRVNAVSVNNYTNSGSSATFGNITINLNDVTATSNFTTGINGFASGQFQNSNPENTNESLGIYSTNEDAASVTMNVTGSTDLSSVNFIRAVDNQGGGTLRVGTTDDGTFTAGTVSLNVTGSTSTDGTDVIIKTPQQIAGVYTYTTDPLYPSVIDTDTYYPSSTITGDIALEVYGVTDASTADQDPVTVNGVKTTYAPGTSVYGAYTTSRAGLIQLGDIDVTVGDATGTLETTLRGRIVGYYAIALDSNSPTTENTIGSVSLTVQHVAESEATLSANDLSTAYITGINNGSASQLTVTPTTGTTAVSVIATNSEKNGVRAVYSSAGKIILNGDVTVEASYLKPSEYSTSTGSTVSGLYIAGGEATLNGDLSVSATETTASTIRGIYSAGSTTVKDGDILVTVTDSTATATTAVYGVNADSGTLDVEGNITVNVSESTVGNTYGVYASGSKDSITVTGAVSLTASGVTQSNYIDGYYGSSSDSVVSLGSISVDVSETTDGMTGSGAYGMRVSDTGSTITVNGAISLSVTDIAETYIRGISQNGATGTTTTVGAISVNITNGTATSPITGREVDGIYANAGTVNATSTLTVISEGYSETGTNGYLRGVYATGTYDETTATYSTSVTVDGLISVTASNTLDSAPTISTFQGISNDGGAVTAEDALTVTLENYTATTMQGISATGGTTEVDEAITVKASTTNSGLTVGTLQGVSNTGGTVTTGSTLGVTLTDYGVNTVQGVYATAGTTEVGGAITVTPTTTNSNLTITTLQGISNAGGTVTADSTLEVTLSGYDATTVQGVYSTDGTTTVIGAITVDPTTTSDLTINTLQGISNDGGVVIAKDALTVTLGNYSATAMEGISATAGTTEVDNAITVNASTTSTGLKVGTLQGISNAGGSVTAGNTLGVTLSGYDATTVQGISSTSTDGSTEVDGAITVAATATASGLTVGTLRGISNTGGTVTAEKTLGVTLADYGATTVQGVYATAGTTEVEGTITVMPTTTSSGLTITTLQGISNAGGTVTANSALGVTLSGYSATTVQGVSSTSTDSSTEVDGAIAVATKDTDITVETLQGISNTGGTVKANSSVNVLDTHDDVTTVQGVYSANGTTEVASYVLVNAYGTEDSVADGSTIQGLYATGGTVTASAFAALSQEYSADTLQGINISGGTTNLSTGILVAALSTTNEKIEGANVSGGTLSASDGAIIVGASNFKLTSSGSDIAGLMVSGNVTSVETGNILIGVGNLSSTSTTSTSNSSSSLDGNIYGVAVATGSSVGTLSTGDITVMISGTPTTTAVSGTIYGYVAPGGPSTTTSQNTTLVFGLTASQFDFSNSTLSSYIQDQMDQVETTYVSTSSDQFTGTFANFQTVDVLDGSTLWITSSKQASSLSGDAAVFGSDTPSGDSSYINNIYSYGGMVKLSDSKDVLTFEDYTSTGDTTTAENYIEDLENAGTVSIGSNVDLTTTQGNSSNTITGNGTLTFESTDEDTTFNNTGKITTAYVVLDGSTTTVNNNTTGQIGDDSNTILTVEAGTLNNNDNSTVEVAEVDQDGGTVNNYSSASFTMGDYYLEGIGATTYNLNGGEINNEGAIGVVTLTQNGGAITNESGATLAAETMTVSSGSVASQGYVISPNFTMDSGTTVDIEGGYLIVPNTLTVKTSTGTADLTGNGATLKGGTLLVYGEGTKAEIYQDSSTPIDSKVYVTGQLGIGDTDLNVSETTKISTLSLANDFIESAMEEAQKTDNDLNLSLPTEYLIAVSTQVTTGDDGYICVGSSCGASSTLALASSIALASASAQDEEAGLYFGPDSTLMIRSDVYEDDANAAAFYTTSANPVTVYTDSAKLILGIDMGTDSTQEGAERYNITQGYAYDPDAVWSDSNVTVVDNFGRTWEYQVMEEGSEDGGEGSYVYLARVSDEPEDICKLGYVACNNIKSDTDPSNPPSPGPDIVADIVANDDIPEEERVEIMNSIANLPFAGGVIGVAMNGLMGDINDLNNHLTMDSDTFGAHGVMWPYDEWNNMWLDVHGTWYNQKHLSASGIDRAGWRANAFGFILGYDRKLKDRPVAIGAAFSFTGGNVKSTGNISYTKNKYQEYGAHFYANYSPNEHLNVIGALHWMHNVADVTQNIGVTGYNSANYYSKAHGHMNTDWLALGEVRDFLLGWSFHVHSARGTKIRVLQDARLQHSDRWTEHLEDSRQG